MLRITKFGKVAGKFPIEDLKKLFDFCKRFDVIDGVKDGVFIFDVRPTAIHWLSRDRKFILSSLYCDWKTGEVKLQKGSVLYMDGKTNSLKINWNEEIATKKWNELIKKVII